MNSSALEDRIGVACKRVGPGRLPGADRPDIGAGYAGASGALVAAVAFSAVVLGLAALGSPLNVGDPVLAVLAAYALPFVVPAAFVAGVVTWRALPERTPWFGAVAGVVGTLLAYLGAVALLAAFLFVAALSQSGTEPAAAAVFAAVIGYIAFLLTVWVMVPIGCLGGLIYERVGVTG